ncbi:hypothetical protein ACL7TT_06760 [Microbulbifer sp. 2304DJ12-6]|uniref:hypothetical protein n=1 Tax=Microbulbifer sp. 2304DJ12-6 TaxID=3233340 RepID=UPI0039B09D4A
MRYFVLLTILISSVAANAAGDGYQAEIDSFFNLLKKGKIEESVSSIYKTNPYMSSVSDQVLNIKNQLASLSGLVGEMNTLQKIDTYNVEDAFVHVTYLAAYDRQPIRFEFQFFKVKEDWRIYAFSFDDNMDDEIEFLARKKALQSSN